DPARIMDLAIALEAAAKREHNEALQLKARCQRMLAWQRAGELRKALAEFDELSCAESARALPIFAAMQHMAGLLHSLIGKREDGEALLQSALVLDLNANNTAAAAHDVFSLATIAAQNRDYARAVEILQEKADVISASFDPRLMEKRETMLARFERGRTRKESAMPVSIGLQSPLRGARL